MCGYFCFTSPIRNTGQPLQWCREIHWGTERKGERERTDSKLTRTGNRVCHPHSENRLEESVRWQLHSGWKVLYHACLHTSECLHCIVDECEARRVQAALAVWLPAFGGSSKGKDLAQVRRLWWVCFSVAHGCLQTDNRRRMEENIDTRIPLPMSVICATFQPNEGPPLCGCWANFGVAQSIRCWKEDTHRRTHMVI